MEIPLAKLHHSNSTFMNGMGLKMGNDFLVSDLF